MSDVAGSAGEKGGGRVTLVGTAHVSETSVREVEETIAAESPDVVAVELDEGRFRQMRGETPEALDASDLLRGNTVFQFLAYWMLSYVQARLGDRFEIEPGADMMAAVETAEASGIDVALVDRDIQVTIQRFWARLTAIEKLRLVGGLATGAVDPVVVGVGVGLSVGVFFAILAETFAGPLLLPATLGPGILVALLDGVALAAVVGLGIGAALAAVLVLTAPDESEYEEFDVESLTDTDVVSAMMEEFRRFSPGGAEALIDERDAYIAHNLLGLREAGKHVVAVVGAGHREGIERYLRSPETLPPMADLTGRETGSRFSAYKLFGYLFTLGFLVFFALVAMAGVRQAFLFQLLAAWFVVNAVFAFGLAKLAGAHWTSAGVGGAVAWLTSVNPLLAPGWFAGYVELRYIDVNVGDISTLNELLDDEERPIRDLVGDMLDVPLFRLIVIVALTNVGSFVGSVLFVAIAVPALFAGAGIESAGDVAALMLRGARNSLDLVLGGLS
ncbi:MAG: TraB/GumN family protein [Haloarculaceae archaeon]